MKSNCDVQNRDSNTSFKLTKVGVTGVRKVLHIRRKGDKSVRNPLICDIDVFVDLPSNQKGSHMSRNLEVIRETVTASFESVSTGIEDVAVSIGKMLLDKHDYASVTTVNISADYFKNSVTPHGKETTEVYKIIGKAICERNGNVKKTIGAQVIGMTACPCAQENVAETLKCSKEWPVITHNQRNICTVIMTMDENQSIDVDGLIDLINDSFSSPTYELLKRDDEAAIVINAHKNPKFVEDIARCTLTKIMEKYPELPDDVEITVKSESEESIHKHNAYAECTATMYDLRHPE